MRIAPLPAVLLAALALFVPGAGSAARQADPVTLLGTVGPGPVITLTTEDGQGVTTLVAGTYTIKVSDKAVNHDFHLFGPDLNQTTTVPEVTDTTWNLTLKPGAYAFVCDPHEATGTMRGTFSVVAPTRVAATLDTKQVVGQLKGGKRGSGAFGATLTRTATGATLDWQLSFGKLTGAAVAAHIHSGRPGRSGGILVPLCGPCRSGQTGTANVSAAALTALLSGSTYVNVHTKKNTGGEIRGQVSVQG